ncbi:MAG: alpha/beta hydrolase [Ureaplasma sp.]|nr:alpha/beta hydrolase [Ureaplasma sp.]
MEFKNVFILKRYKNPKYNIILLHGFISSKNIFEKIINNINITNANYYAFDYEETIIKNKSKLIFESFPEQLLEFVKKYNLDNIILVAHSMGGGVASLSYSSLKDKIKKIVLISPLSRSVLISKAGITFFNGTVTNRIKIIRNTLFSKKNQDNEYSTDIYIMNDYERFLKEKSKHIELGLSLISLTRLNKVMNCYKTIERPTLILLGKDDKIIPGSTAKHEFEKMKKDNFQIILWENVGHVSWIENFEQFKETFSEFINK